MKFKIRDGFIVHHSKLVDIDLGNGNIKQEIQTATYYQGQTVDFTVVDAEQHLHKLEPLDDAARQYVSGRHVPTPPAVSGTADLAALSGLIAQGIAQAMSAMNSAPSTAPAKS